MQSQQRYFRFGPVRQETGSKHLRLGDLLVAKNVRQTAKAGVYAKRKGFARTAQTFVGGSLSGSPVEILPGENGNTFMRDSGDQIWSRSQSTNAWNLLGTHPRPWVETKTIQSNLYTVPQPFGCLVGSTLWSFALKTNAYEFTITSVLTGEVLTSRTTVTATGVVHASAVYDGTNVWVFWVDNGTNGIVRCHKFVVATPKVAPTATTFVSIGTIDATYGSMPLQQVQARYMSAINKVFVVAAGGAKPSNYMQVVVIGSLDAATGTADTGSRAAALPWFQNAASPGNVNKTSYCGGICIPEGQDGSAANWYFFFYYGEFVASNCATRGRRVKVSTTNFGTRSTLALPLSYGTNDVATVVSASGFADNTGNGKQYVIETAKNTGTATNVWTYLTMVDDTTITYGGIDAATATRASVSVNSSWAASGFCYANSAWWFITSRDDRGTNVAEDASVQRGFQLRKFVPGANAAACTLQIFGQFLVGSAAANLHRVASDITITPPTWPSTNVPPLLLYSATNTMFCPLAVRGGISGTVDIALASVETAKVYGKGAQISGRAYFPGSIPVSVFSGSAPHETTPLLNPEWITATAGGSDYSICAVVYAIYDDDGTVWRSSPKVLSQSFAAGATISFPTPVFYWGNTSQVCAEVYIGNNGTPKLQKVFSPYVDGAGFTLTYTVPALASQIDGEILYTTGNALSNTWPVACQTIGAWGNRLFFAQKNRVWVSKELEQGFGPLFNEVQVTPWNEENMEITAIAPVDWNYLAVFSRDQTGVINGAGPDGIGNGNFVIKTLPTYTGVAPGSQAVQGAQGCYYQNPATGRIMVVTPALQVIEGAGGAYDYAGYTFSTACWYESENLMLFLAPASNAAIVIDYQHPQEVAPFGQVYLWTFAAAAGLSLVCRDDYGLLAISSAGHVHRPASQWTDDKSGGTDSYQMDIITAPLQLADLQGEITVSSVQALLTMRGSTGLSLGTYPNYSSLTASDPRTTMTSIDLPTPVNDGDAESVMTRPPYCARIQAVNVRILEKAGVISQSFEFEGLAVFYTATGRALRPREGRII